MSAPNADSAPEWESTWLRFDDVTCVRCRRLCGPVGATVYYHDREGCVCDECYAAHIDGSVRHD